MKASRRLWVLYKYYEKISMFFYQLQFLKLKILGASIGKKSKAFGWFKVLGDPKNLIIGNNVKINEGVFINCRDKVILEDFVTLSSFAKIYSTQLDYKKFPRIHVKAPVIIKKNTWIASDCLVLMGVTIGENSVIGARSLVSKDVESDALYIGDKVVKKLNIKYD